MNQVTELLRLAPGASTDDALARLSTLFEIMGSEDGFRDAEVLRRCDEPNILLVLHTWNTVDHWCRFRTSELKMTFAASRPDSLYAFLPCGMNWRLEAGDAGERDSRFLRREVVRDWLAPDAGPCIVASQTFTYRDYEPKLAGTMLRLTRLDSPPRRTGPIDDHVLADEVYESLKTYGGVTRRASIAS